MGENDVTMPVPGIGVTSQIELWWRRKGESEKSVLDENGEMSSWLWF